ncbi:GntR family transcriptional regulator [Pseudaestuariivita sp.]|uniref:GntR family transcriptional regulator n=1 Tax=Pseudaestuariivita sp. TaxID=2211669 RepID=UPI004059F4AC
MSKPTKEHCQQDLIQRILLQELAPGEDLDEARVAAQYGMSRTPLREVLQRLAGAGYVVLNAGRGATVAAMSIAELRTFFQTAPMIYAAIARLAAENATAAQITQLKETQRGFARAALAGETRAAALGNHAFHAEIGAMAHNPYLTACLDRLLIDHTRLSQTFFRPATPEDADLVTSAVAHHEAMIAAIEARDADVHAALALEHWDLSKDRIARFVRPDPLPLDAPPSATPETADAL